MDVKRAVSIAKNHVASLFVDENPSNIGLEEIEFNDADLVWEVTIGFTRPWDNAQGAFVSLTKQIGPNRSFKVITISDADGKLKSIKNRSVE